MTRTTRLISVPTWIVLVAALLSLAVIGIGQHQLAHRAPLTPSVNVSAPTVDLRPAPAPAAPVVPKAVPQSTTNQGTQATGNAQAPSVPASQIDSALSCTGLEPVKPPNKVCPAN